jgi:protein-S-isoprenylcysteine O-methyltransferase Ste14
MTHWPFVIAAYGIVLAGAAALLLWAWTTMRAAEARAEQARGE